MGIDNRLIAMAGETPNVMNSFINAQEQGMKVGAARQGMESKNRLAQLVASKPVNMPMSTFMEQQGMGDQALEYGKTEADIAKTQAEAQAKQFDSHLKKIEIAGKATQEMLMNPNLNKQVVMDTIDRYYQAGLTDAQMYQMQKAKMAELPDDPQQLRAHIEAQVQALQSAKDQMSYARPDANAQLSAQTQQRGQDLSANTQMRGQDITALNQDRNYGLDQVRLNRDITNDELRTTLDANKLQLERDKYNNPSKASKPTEAQSKAALYANRMQEAENVLSSLDYSPAALGTKEGLSNVPLIGGVLGAGANVMMSKESQQAEQAQRNFINATLRRESGAVISPNEFENAKKQYFPSVGDSPEVLAQKAQNRQTAISALQAEAQGSIPEMSKSGSWQKPSDWEQFLKERGK